MKKNTKKRFSLLALLLMLCLLMVPVQVSAATIKLNKTTASIKIGKTTTLKISGTSSTVTWSSSDKTVAKVSSNGVVTGVSLGTATITAKVNGNSYTCKVTVKNASATATSLIFKTSGGGNFIIGASKAKVSFKLSDTSADVVVSIKSSSGSTVYKKTYAKCTAGKTYSFTWDGVKTNGKKASAGTYTVQVKAYKTKTTSDSLILYKQVFAGGTGTSSNPFQIATLAQLQKIPQYNGCYFKQTKNINADYSTIASMFTEETPFTGTYNGNGYTISNLYISPDSNGKAGLFLYIGASGAVKNLNFSNVNVTATSSAGIVSCYNYGTVTNCGFTKCNVSSSGGGGTCIGLVAGTNESSGRIVKCTTSDCNASASNTGFYYSSQGSAPRVGSMAGENNGNITDCTSTNITVSNKSNGWGGAIVGRNYGNVINCTASGSVSAKVSSGIYGIDNGVTTGCYFKDTTE